MGGPLEVGMGNNTGAADENAAKVGKSSAAALLGPEPGPKENEPGADGALSVDAAMARMSMRPEPSWWEP